MADLIDAETARRIVREMLAAAEKSGGVPCELVGEAKDFGRWWVQGYQSRAFVEGGDILSALAGNGPIAVPKDGSEPFALSSAEPAADQMERLQRADDADPHV
ncbi:YrhB domain-containing protein [Microbacterium sp. BWT-B31]|uniref:YrhB domain-containing protein n=1 Tax=Microbacterium sp. BWT-B31 TaxID=3232072 RepID=UPI003526D4C2